MASPEAPHWKEAVARELDSIVKHDTWEEEDLPKGRIPLDCRWIFTKKYDKDGNVIRYKARLVVKGYKQKAGIDFVETFAPVIKFKSIRILAAIAAQFKMPMYQYDVPTAFLKGDLKEEIYLKAIPGVPMVDASKVLRLLKTLYGLKQSPREWNEVITKFLISCGFQVSQADPCIFWRNDLMGKKIYVGVYVDDIIVTGNDETSVGEFIEALKQKFGIQEGGVLQWYLGIRFDQTKCGISMDQVQFLKNKLVEFDSFVGAGGSSSPLPLDYLDLLRNEQLLKSEEPNFPYRQMVGSLMYAMIGTRPDLATAIGIVCRYLQNPKKIHCELVRHIYRYVRSNLEFKLQYSPSERPLQLVGYADASYANGVDFKSTSGYAYMLGNCLVSWYSGKQSVVAQSSAEAEYYAAVISVISADRFNEW